MRSKTHERALVQAPARLRANVPSCLLRRATYVLRRGVAEVERERLVCFSFAGVFFFKQKENAETLEEIKYLVKVGSESRG